MTRLSWHDDHDMKKAPEGAFLLVGIHASVAQPRTAGDEPPGQPV